MFGRDGSARFGISETFVDGCQSGLVFVIRSGNGLLELRFFGLGHENMVAIPSTTRNRTAKYAPNLLPQWARDFWGYKMTVLKITDGAYGPRATLTSAWSDGMLASLNAGGVVELELNQAKGWGGDDLSFLAKLPALKLFEIFDFRIKDISPIHSLHNLKRLGVTTYCKTEIDFDAFPQLESCGFGVASKSEVAIYSHHSKTPVPQSI